MNRKTFSALLGVIALLGLLLAAGCSSKKENTEQSASPVSESKPAPAAAPIDPATAAAVSGTVDMSQDPACKGDNKAETVVAEGGNLANVFVYVKDGLGNRNFDVPKTAVVIDQKGCRYHPHVLGVMAGQQLEVKNDDPTTHNIHPTPKAGNQEWNESQGPGAAPIDKSFSREEIMLPVKCNQHPWMKMYINVVKNPFYAVTDKDGKYKIEGLPPGTYTLAFVQEKLGEQHQQVTLAAKDSKTVDTSFKAQ
jgi:plastocyanin